VNKKNIKHIFLLFSCDIWKSNMSLTCAAITRSKIKNAIVRAIHRGDMCYENEDISITRQIQLFRKDWKDKPSERLNDNLLFGFIDTIENGGDY